MQVGTVSMLFRYPVKSMAGENLDELVLGPRGVPGDRAWAVRDEVRGGIRGGKRFPELMRCSAVYEGEPPFEGSTSASVTLPDGLQLAIDAPEMPELLSGLVGNPVSVWPLLPKERLDHYRRGAPTHEDMAAEFRQIFGRTEDEPLPDVSKYPEFLAEFASPPGTYFDSFPLLIMTTESLAHLQHTAPAHRFDVNRFRPNLLIETSADAPFPERDWPGKTMHVGDAEINIEMDCTRCVMTTHGFAGLPKDPGIMRSLVKHAGGELGVYASIKTPGRVRVGDILELA